MRTSEEINEIRIDGFCWRLISSLDPCAVAPVLGPGRLCLAGVDAQLVKEAPHRVVHRLQIAGLDLHIKHYRGTRRDWFRSLFRGRKATREFVRSREVARRGIPTLEVLGFGESIHRLGPADSFLLTRTLPDAEPLLSYLESRLPMLTRSARARTQHCLAERVGELFAHKHAAGVLHRDLHPGNLLVRFEKGVPDLFLIDLDAVTLGSPLDWPTSRANLLVIDRWFAMRWNRSDRRRAWRAYCQARTDLVLDERELAGDLFERTRSSLLDHARQLDRRCQGGNRHYRDLSVADMKGFAVADLSSDELAGLLVDPDAPFSSPQAKTLKRAVSSTVIELEMKVGDRVRPVILKRFEAKHGLDALARLFRTPPAMRSYLTGHAFRVRGLPTPRPLAVWQRRRFGLHREGYLLVEKVPEAVHLVDYVEMLARRPTGERTQRLWAVIDQLARLIRQMHDWGLSHRDLKAANLLVSPAGSVMSERGLREREPGPQPHKDNVWFVDLVGVRTHRHLQRMRKVRDLARLHVSFVNHPALSRSDRLRFMRTYLAWGLVGKTGWKEWWRDIDRVAREKVARNIRLGRVVA